MVTLCSHVDSEVSPVNYLSYNFAVIRVQVCVNILVTRRVISIQLGPALRGLVVASISLKVARKCRYYITYIILDFFYMYITSVMVFLPLPFLVHVHQWFSDRDFCLMFR